MAIRVLFLFILVNLTLTCNRKYIKRIDNMSTTKPPPQYTLPPAGQPAEPPPKEPKHKKPTYKKPVYKGSILSVKLLRESKTLMDSIEEGHVKTKEALDNTLSPQ